MDCGEALAPDVDTKLLLHGTSWEGADSSVIHVRCLRCQGHKYRKSHMGCAYRGDGGTWVNGAFSWGGTP